jgi:ribosomal-protein-alanine N-acetyltransferase
VSHGFAQALSGPLDLHSADYRLSPLARADAEDLFAHFADPAVVEFMDIDAHASLDEALGVIGWSQSLRAAGTGARWAVHSRRESAFVGTIGFNSLVWERGRRGEIGYDVARRYWGKRVMDQVLPVVLDFGFETLGLRRIEAMVTDGNAPSCRLLERHGFEREGLLRDHAHWKGRFWDQIVYGRVADSPSSP